jgi:hypothetical protein
LSGSFQDQASGGGTGETIYDATSPVATSVGEVRLRNGKSAELIGEAPTGREILDQSEYPYLNVNVLFP